MVRPSPAFRRAAAVLAGALLLAACGGGPEVAASPSPADVVASPPTPTPTPTPPASPSPIPAVPIDEVPDDLADVDVVYGQAVIDALDAEMGEVARLLVAAGGEFDEDSLARLLSLYDRDSQADVQANWREYILPRLPEDPGQPVTVVESISSRGDGCFAIDGTRDLSGLGVPTDVVSPSTWTVSFLVPEAGTSATNPTAWVIDKESDEGLEDACAG